jgi:hypothetical protein
MNTTTLKLTAVIVNTGEKYDHINGNEYILGGLYYKFSAAVCITSVAAYT